MNLPVPYLHSKSNGSLLSPPSSPEMDKHHPVSGDGCWPSVRGQQSFPLESARPDHFYTVDDVAQWTQQRDPSGLRIAPTQQGCHNLDLSSDSFDTQNSQQVKWQSRPGNEEGIKLNAAMQPHLRSHNTSQTHPVALGAPSSSSTGSAGDEDDDDETVSTGEDDGQSSGDVPSQTAAERLAEKRKMKRFRLTHSQTRFLMSEFARQAHPDTAQRERLSRQIPGLSPRQVQVWFQNRRAKLKRLTIDDQESIMKSRALPAGFDTAQALNYTHDVPSHSDLGGPSSFFHTSHPDYEMRKPNTTGRSSRAGDNGGNISPTSVLSSFVDTAFSMSDTFSPISLSSETPHFFTPATSQCTSPSASSSFTRSSSFPNIHQTPWCRYGSPPQQTQVRSRTGSLATPVSHTAQPLEQNVHDPGMLSHAGHFQSYLQQNLTNPDSITSRSGLNYNTFHPPQTITEGHVTLDTTWPGFTSNVAGCSPIDTSCLIDVDWHRIHESLGVPSRTQHAQPVRQVQSAPLAAPPDFHPSVSTAPYQPSEAQLLSTLEYSGVPPTDQLWIPAQLNLPHQPRFSHPTYLGDHAVPGSSYNQDNTTPGFEQIDGWPE
ncbi:MAG: hypothetical protein Q9213_000290 [Squamulea squamosa]